jgi:hypothetical protein
MPRQRKRAAQGILGFAAIGSTATIIRLPWLMAFKDSYLGTDGEFLCQSRNFQETYAQLIRVLDKIAGIIVWSFIEMSVGISAGSIATLRPLARKACECLSGSSDNRHNNNFRFVRPRSRISTIVPLPKVWNGAHSRMEFDRLPSAGQGPAAVSQEQEQEHGVTTTTTGNNGEGSSSKRFHADTGIWPNSKENSTSGPYNASDSAGRLVVEVRDEFGIQESRV